MVWFTGLPSSGKTTIAGRVCETLAQLGLEVEHLDGDAIRQLVSFTGFTRADRDAHVKWVGYLASQLERHGVFVAVSLVSPYAEARAFVRSLCRNFVEVYVSTPLEECERRDAKGLYARARRGEIQSFTGIDDPYEPPLRPDLTIDTRHRSVDEACAAVLATLDGLR